MPAPDLSNILCHPGTHEPLQWMDGQWVAPQTGERFPVIKDIPRLISSQKPVRHRFWEWVYNRTAFAYDWGVAFAWRLQLGGQPIERQAYLQKINIQPGHLVLETAVGTGENIRHLPSNARYIGLDISVHMLLHCRKNLTQWGRQAALVQGDAQFLPFRDEVFDVIYHMGGLQFIHRPQKALAEALRVSKPGGRIWVIDEMYSIPGLLKRSKVQQKTLRMPGVDALPAIVPHHAVDIYAESISNGELYLLSFRK